MTNTRADAAAIFAAGVRAADPAALIRETVRREGASLLIGGRRINLSEQTNIYVTGAGKASASMTITLADILEGLPVRGLVSVPEDCVVPCTKIRIAGGRPRGINLPDARTVALSQHILGELGALTAEDIVIALISGGGSACLCAPRPPYTLEDKLAATKRMFAQGAPIEAINAMRASMSLVKGGGLVHATSAGQLIGLILSDVMSNDLAAVASGPTVTDTPGNVLLSNHLLADNGTAVTAAANCARALGYEVVHTRAHMTGDVEQTARNFVADAIATRRNVPICLIEGGEPVISSGHDLPPGGRNQHGALAARIALADTAGITMLFAGTDGEDGSTHAAGAFADQSIDLDGASEALANYTSHDFHVRKGSLFVTGATGTNVADLRIVLVEPGC